MLRLKAGCWNTLFIREVKNDFFKAGDLNNQDPQAAAGKVVKKITHRVKWVNQTLINQDLGYLYVSTIHC